MALEPHVALFETAPGSQAFGQIFIDFFQAIAEQQILPEKLSKFTTGVVFSCDIARLAKLVSKKKIFWSYVTLMPNCMSLMEIHL